MIYSFIPQYIFENMVKAGIENARVNLFQSIPLREMRQSKALDTARLAGVIRLLAGTSGRLVYDCRHIWEYENKAKIKLVRDEEGPSTGDNAVDAAYEYAGIIRNYYKNQLNRNSIDNQGMDLVFNVHFGENFANAFWDGKEMVFGDGDGVQFVNLTKSLDVIAHEMAHGVTQYEANFDYQGQPGALHEHFSDVFGTVITQYANKETAEKADWLIGDEIMGPELYGEALRSMKEPGTAYDNDIMDKDPQPSHMKDIYQGTEDHGGVHINSGIMNKVFYIASMDLGTDMTALIWYHALQNLWPTAQFADAARQLAKSARVLTKDTKVPLGSAQKVRAALKEVGLYK